MLGPEIFFQTTGTHTIRVQSREDGIGIDQIVISPGTYLFSSPGALKNDITILPASNGSAPPPPPPQPSPPVVTSITPVSGTTAGGTSVTISGSNFNSGASVTFGGAAATNVSVVNSTTITVTTAAHTAGAVNVVVTNTNALSGTLTSGFTYTTPTPPPETIILEDNFNDNLLDQSKWAVNSLYSGFTDAAVPSSETNQRYQVGGLVQGQSGSHYNGIRSASAFNFTGAYSYVELVQVLRPQPKLTQCSRSAGTRTITIASTSRRESYLPGEDRG